jgi:hypothetical protein
LVIRGDSFHYNDATVAPDANVSRTYINHDNAPALLAAGQAALFATDFRRE